MPAMTHNYLSTFIELIATPFEHGDLIWGIVPLYFGLLPERNDAIEGELPHGDPDRFQFSLGRRAMALAVFRRTAGTVRVWNWTPFNRSICSSRFWCWRWARSRW
ncbi:MAG: hypothetical protein WDM76_16045 [Limisphaerales bacterium]